MTHEQLLKIVADLNPISFRPVVLKKLGVFDEIQALQQKLGCSASQVATWLKAGTPEQPICSVCNTTPCKWKGDNWSLACSNQCTQRHPQTRATTSAAAKKVDQKQKQQRREQTTLEKYGYKHVLQVPEIVDGLKRNREQSDYEQRLQTMQQCFSFDVTRVSEWESMLSNCDTAMSKFAIQHGTTHSTLLRWFREIGLNHLTYFPHTSSGGERELASWIENQFGFQVVRNYRGWDPENYRSELDIWIPEKRVAIEYNGLYWHIDKDHLKKTERAKANDIFLIQVFEDEWKEKQQIIKSIIAAKLGQCKRLGARGCIKDQHVSRAEAAEFLNAHHLNGFLQSSKKFIGLRHKQTNELLAVASFGQSRWGPELELHRYAIRGDLLIIGGFGKLIQGEPTFITYCDQRFSGDSVYAKYGRYLRTTHPDYFWTDGVIRLPRYATMKSKLPKLLGNKFDPNETEVANMERAGYGKIWGCGHAVYVVN